MSFFLPLHINNAENIIVEKSDRFKKLCKDDDNLVFSCTSYLTLKKKYQGKGLGMALIQESLQMGYDNGCIGAYFVNKISRCSNSIHFKFYGVELKSLNVPIHNLNSVKVDKTNAEEALNYYLEQGKNLKTFFSPSLIYWKKWIKVFPTYIIKKNGLNIGLFSLKYYNIYISVTKKELKYCGNLLCIGQQPETLNALIHTCKKNYDFLNIAALGSIDEDMLKNLNITASNSNYINFYNCKMIISKDDFHLPIF